MKKQLIAVFALSLATTGFVHAQNTSFGIGALANITTGNDNSAFGFETLFNTTTGSVNTGAGAYALHENINGNQNIGIGYASLYSNIDGNENTAIGTKCLASNTSGNGNIGIGEGTLNSNTVGNYNVGIGNFAIPNNQTGEHNVAIGQWSLYTNQNGEHNSANGQYSAYNNVDGSYNIAYGYASLYDNVNGDVNIAIGAKALTQNVSGNSNVAVGSGSGPNNTFYSNTGAFGSGATTTASNQVRIGNSAVNDIGGYAFWTNISDGRFKEDIQENVVGLDFVKKLRPVSYYVNREKLDNHTGASKNEFYVRPEGDPQYQTGFIAQEVEALVQETGFSGFNGVKAPANAQDHYGLRYSEFVVPLVKSVQELSANQDKLLDRIAELEELLAETNERMGEAGSSVTAKGFELGQNQPNPFTVNTKINMVIPEGTNNAQLIVYNMEGKQLKTYRVSGTGTTSVDIQANELEAGMYIYALLANGKVITTKQMILTK